LKFPFSPPKIQGGNARKFSFFCLFLGLYRAFWCQNGVEKLGFTRFDATKVSKNSDKNEHKKLPFISVEVPPLRVFPPYNQ